MKALILLCTILISFSQYAIAQHEIFDAGNILEVSIVGKQKYDRLTSKGVRMPGAIMSFSNDSKHKFLGSIVECSAPFNISKFSLTVHKCMAEKAIFQLTFRKIEADGAHQELLDVPLLFSMRQSLKSAEYYVTPDSDITIEPGTYYIGIALLNVTGDTQEVLFPLYLKKSFIIPNDSNELQEYQYNIGLSVAGRKIKE